MNDPMMMMILTEEEHMPPPHPRSGTTTPNTHDMTDPTVTVDTTTPSQPAKRRAVSSLSLQEDLPSRTPPKRSRTDDDLKEEDDSSSDDVVAEMDSLMKLGLQAFQDRERLQQENTQLKEDNAAKTSELARLRQALQQKNDMVTVSVRDSFFEAYMLWCV